MCVLYIISNEPLDFIVALNRNAKYIRRGDCPRKCIFKYNQITLPTSSAGFDNVKGQMRDSVNFVKRNIKIFNAILDKKVKAQVFIDFATDNLLSGQCYMNEVDFKVKDMALLSSLNIGIKLSIYTTSG